MPPFFIGGTVAVVGMNRRTGALLSGMDHLLQSLTDILSTRRGTRRERPEYGSDLPDKVDLPITRGWVAAAQAEAARAITRWEPRLRLSRVRVEGIEDGRVVWRVVGIYNERAVDLKVMS